MARHDRAVFFVPVAVAYAVLIVFGCGREAPVEPTEAIVKARVLDKPNVVLIIVDTLRADKLGCYGFEKDTSPELDAMAHEGVQFTHAVAQCSWTRPSIASLITGRYPRSLGLYKEKDEMLADDFDTLAEILRAQGYATVGITANPVINSVFNMHQGFDKHFDSNVRFSWMRPEEGKVTARNHASASAREIFDAMLDYARQVPTLPCYMQINIMEMHEYWRKRLTLTRAEFRNLFPGTRNPRYLQALRQVSVDVDAFVRALADLPGWDDTLFVITSDHGQGLDNHPSVPIPAPTAGILYESQIMVPLILYHPQGTVKPRHIQRPVRLLDFVPTILDYLDVPAPEGLDGTSLWPLVEDPEDAVDLPEGFVTETEYRTFNKIALYTKDWKYIENRDGHPRVNPRELQPMGIRENGKRTDQIGQYPEAAAALKETLESWETRYRKVPPTARTEGISEEELEQLKAIGYLQ